MPLGCALPIMKGEMCWSPLRCLSWVVVERDEFAGLSSAKEIKTNKVIQVRLEYLFSNSAASLSISLKVVSRWFLVSVCQCRDSLLLVLSSKLPWMISG